MLSQSACTGEKKPSSWAKLKEKSKDVFRGVGTVFRTGSFLLILAGNIISVIIGLGLGYKIMYLQVEPLGILMWLASLRYRRQA